MEMQTFQRALAYPAALDAEGNVILVEEAKKEAPYFCPLCRTPFIIREGAKRRKHFAHKRLPEKPCSVETVTHLAAKNIIARALRAAIRENRPYPIRWLCPECGKEHVGNLARPGRQVELEAPIGKGARADVLVKSKRGKPLVAIEVVVSHFPEPETLDFYRSQRITVVIVPVKPDSLADLFEGIHLTDPEYVYNAPCRQPLCPSCAERCRLCLRSPFRLRS